jgi:hypothetical protein
VSPLPLTGEGRKKAKEEVKGKITRINDPRLKK